MKATLFCLFAICASMLHALPAFPGAEGWGTETPGGRGGKVLIVTNLNSKGPGSLRAALQTTGPRIIVFRVSGVIDLQPTQSDQWELAENLSYVTVAGQTSPGGITVIGSSWAQLRCYTNCRNFHDAIFRFIRFRTHCSENAAGYDGVDLSYANNYVIDHCDFSGGLDEASTFSHCYNFTLQWCTFSNTNSFTDANPGKATLISGPELNRMSMHHNLWANTWTRGGPLIHTGGVPPIDNGLLDYRNNICYNSSIYSLQIGGDEADSGKVPWFVNVIGNSFIDGPSRQKDYANVRMDEGMVKPFSDNNLFTPYSGTPVDAKPRVRSDTSVAYAMPHVTTAPALQNYETVLQKVGAFPRDSLNKRTVEDVRNFTGPSYYDVRQDSLPYKYFCFSNAPLITDGPEPPADADRDGMADQWETMMGFNPADSTDALGDHDGDGYTNIEEYINDLAKILLGELPDNSVSAIEFLQTNIKSDKSSVLGFSPSPFSGSVNLTFTVAFSSGSHKNKGIIQIIDIKGKLINELTSTSSFTWNGLDSRGSQIAPGLYIIRLKVGGAIIARKSLIRL